LTAFHSLFEQAALFPSALSPRLASAWTQATSKAKSDWTHDFGGEQFSLGHAFYTHLETGGARAYFASSIASDALVERVLPTMQETIRVLFAKLVRARQVRQRVGFCGAGVHVFPARGKVARVGGVIHSDTEGLSPWHIMQKCRAITLVVMLQPPTWGGGLWTWPVFADNDRAEGALDALEHLAPQKFRYRVGDALAMPSRQVHQIRPFRGELDRVSITLHGVETVPGSWETWF
jgi:hypothetical protein